MEDLKNYREMARQARLRVLEMIYCAQVSHIGSNFSCIDILTVLFNTIDLDKDKFVLSAGWKAASLYYFLWQKGIITEDELNSYCQPGSKFIGLAEPIIPEIPFAGGSMGMGFPAAVGFALAKKLKGEEGIVYVLMSDGELQCGTTWEAALIASQHNLDNLVVIVDRNKFCAMGRTSDVLDTEPAQKVFVTNGWEFFRGDGHDFGFLERAISNSTKSPPTVIVCDTIKGYPVSFMSDSNLYHYKAPSFEEHTQAMVELSSEK